jgi:sirohydrochlorin ferrochelatase
MPVASGFLELAQPTIAQGLAELADRGVRRVIAVPLLLFTAVHAKDDVPAEVAQAAQAVGMEMVGQSAALGLHPRLLELSRIRFEEACNRLLSGTVLLMVGRGGSDETALEEMRGYSAALSASLGVWGTTAFVAVAQPSLEDALADIGRSQHKAIVVLPHLLFQGEVLATIRDRVIEARLRFSDKRWLMAEHLGVHPLLIETVLERMHAAIAAAT